MAGADDFVIAGYVACRCGRWVVGDEPTLCAECKGVVVERVGTVEVAIEGEVVRLSERRPKPRPKLYYRTESGKVDRRARDRAEKRAMRVLARIHRPLFLVLLERELATEGLVRSGETADGDPAEMLAAVGEWGERMTPEASSA